METALWFLLWVGIVAGIFTGMLALVALLLLAIRWVVTGQW